MVGVHAVGFDLPLFSAFLNPLRTASGAEGAMFGAHHDHYSVGPANGAKGQRHFLFPVRA